MLGLFQLLALGLLLALAAATWIVISRLRSPPRRTYGWAVARNRPGDPGELDEPRDFEAFETTLDGVVVHAWDIPGDDPAGPIVVVTPGWGDSKVGVLPRLPALIPGAARVIVWDPPGLGETAGRSPLGTREPGMLLELVRQVGVGGAPMPGQARHATGNGVVLMGWSLGAGAAIVAAELDSKSSGPPLISAVIAEAPYRFAWTPAFNVTRLAGLPYKINGPLAFAWMGLQLTGHPFWKGFDRAEHAAGVACPLLLIHGIDDEICPIEDSRAIAAAAPDAELVTITGGTHNNLWTDEACQEQVAEAVAGFLVPAPAALH